MEKNLSLENQKEADRWEVTVIRVGKYRSSVQIVTYLRSKSKLCGLIKIFDEIRLEFQGPIL